jgi:hypothetical protein
MTCAFSDHLSSSCGSFSFKGFMKKVYCIIYWRFLQKSLMKVSLLKKAWIFRLKPSFPLFLHIRLYSRPLLCRSSVEILRKKIKRVAVSSLFNFFRSLCFNFSGAKKRSSPLLEGYYKRKWVWSWFIISSKRSKPVSSTWNGSSSSPW